MRSLFSAVAVAIAALPAAAGAQPLTEDEAARQLFAVRGIGVAVAQDLSATDRAILQAMVGEAERTRQPFRYYGSIAFAPDAGLQSETLQGAFNFHDLESSDAAALNACEAARQGGRACRIAAQVRPRGFEPGHFQLSYDATNAFRSTYRRTGSPKAFAVSSRTGAWAMAEGSDAGATAEAECNRGAAAMGGATDCVAVIVDP